MGLQTFEVGYRYSQVKIQLILQKDQLIYYYWFGKMTFPKVTMTGLISMMKMSW